MSGSAGAGGRRLDPSGKRALFEATIGAAGEGDGLSREDLIALLSD